MINMHPTNCFVLLVTMCIGAMNTGTQSSFLQTIYFPYTVVKFLDIYFFLFWKIPQWFLQYLKCLLFPSAVFKGLLFSVFDSTYYLKSLVLYLFLLGWDNALLWIWIAFVWHLQIWNIFSYLCHLHVLIWEISN